MLTLERFATLNRLNDAGLSVDLVYEHTLDQLNACTCYTTPAFDGGNACRSVLEKSMSEKADADRQAILALTAQGTSLADAVARYDTGANFQGWFDQLKADLSAAQAAG